MKITSQILLLILVIVAVTSCSSLSKKAASAGDGNTGNTSDEFISDSAAQSNNEEDQGSAAAEEKKSEPAQEEQKFEPVSSAQYGKLNDAIKQQNDDQIQKISSEVLTQNPKDGKALNSLAMVYYKKGRFEAAGYLLNKAIAANPNMSELYGNLGVVQLAQNDRREGIKSFRKALELNSGDYIAGANLGAIYIQEKDFNRAVLALEAPYKKGTKDLKILNNYAIALAATGKGQDAADIYAKILKDNPSQREALLNYSILLIDDLKKYKDGLDLLNRLKFVGPPSEARETIKDLENRAKAGLQ